MKSLPVIFLAFANDRVDAARYLRNLPLEQRQIYEVLEAAEEAKLCEIVSISNATIKQIIDTFQKERYKDRIAIFHFGGHADGYQLLLETETGEHEVAHGKGLVSFLSRQRSLQLVFLNGCTTEQQSQELVDAGVPLVIGTNSSISDNVATRLAVRFYGSLANGANLLHAWRDAEDEIHIRTAGTSSSSRSLDFGLWNDEVVRDAFPWRLILREGAEIVEEWNLPDAANNPLFGLPNPPKKDLPEEPFRFLKWYEADHAEIFFGRSYVIRNLYERITDEHTAPLLLLYGKSGVGKSSLLDAGLLPRLRQMSEVKYVRISNEYTLLKSLRQQLEEKEEDKGKSLKKLWQEKEEVAGKAQVIILDQLEGIYTEGNENREAELEELLVQLKEVFQEVSDRPNGKLILSYRKEYHAEIEKTCKGLQIPREQVYLPALARKDIMEVVGGLSSTERLRRKYRLEVDELLPTIIADDLLVDSHSSIAPVLQILLTKMWELTETEEKRHFSVENYNRLLKEGILLDDFFEQQTQKIRQLHPDAESSGLIIDLLNHHTTDFSTARSRGLEELRKRYLHREDVLETILQELKQLYLLTDIGGKTTLAHDTLAPLVQKEFKESDRPGQRAIRILESKRPSFEQNKEVYLDADDLELVEQGKAGMRFWIKKEEELIERSRLRKAKLEKERARNKRFKQIAVAGLALFSVVISYLGYQAYQEARANEKVVMALEVERTDATQALRLAAEGQAIKPDNKAIRQTLSRIYASNEFYQDTYQQRSPIRALALSPDGKLVLSGDENGRIWRWDEGGNLLDSAKVYEEALHEIVFTPDGEFYATAANDSRLLIWTKGGEIFERLKGDGTPFTSLVFSTDGKQLLGGTRDGKIWIWSWKTGKLDTSFVAHGGSFRGVKSLDYSSDGQRFLSASADTSAKVWTRKGELIRKLDARSDWVLSAYFSDNDQYILTASRDKSAILWDTTGKKIVQLKGHTNRVTKAYFGPGENLFTSGADGIIIQWDKDGNQLKKYVGHGNAINALAFDEKARVFFSASENGTIRKWEIDSKIARQLLHPQISTTTLFTVGLGANNLSFDGSLLATGGEKKYLSNYVRFTDQSTHALPIRIWDLRNKNTYDLEGHEADISSLAFSPDAKSLLSGSMDGSLIFWTLPTSKSPKSESKIIGTHNGGCTLVNWSQDASFFISSGLDSLLNIWNSNGELLQSFRGEDWIRTAAIFPDGKTILTGATDGSLKLWEVGGAEEPSAIWKEHQTAVRSICFSPDGKYLASGDLSNTLILWNDEGEIIWKKDLSGTSLSGSGAIKDIEFSLDSRQIIYASADGGANILDLNGNLLQSMQETAVKFTGVGFAPDGNTVFCAGDDGMVRFYYTLEGYLEHQGMNN
ncbi:MAG: CHAT domain-containing protein [Bacteroidia bacterium]|nr:CHAT domain-containing protein [Bacteroidia bacterium]